MAPIGVVGAGSWGTALAGLLASNGHSVDLWVYEKEVCDQINTCKENRTFLPGFRLGDSIRPSNDLSKVVQGKELVVIVVPSHVFRGIAQLMEPHLGPDTVIVAATKGIENETLSLMSDILEEVFPDRLHSHLCYLSGPSFAKEVAKELPTAVTVASHALDVGRHAQRILANHFFRVYTSSDVVGVELGGAFKNVIAIAAGACDGLELGANARAAVITRGLAEMTRLGMALGANPLTFAGLAGVGDLVLTCCSGLSRNQNVGMQLGRGRKLQEILDSMVMIAEGVRTSKSVYNMAQRMKIELPICEQVHAILYEDKPPLAAVQELMTRELKSEFSGIRAI